ncbi:MAG: class I SAM-dependent methyltransferase [Firmicutes bacterium]|nr:class I SAM-dependent methyltransferase [Bacillota bacterium]
MQKEIILALNRLFPKQRHPLNLNNSGSETYAEWQYEKGADTLSCYAGYCSEKDILDGKNILDMGCGAGGKSLYYASHGAKHVTGVDIVERYARESAELADKLGLGGKFTFVTASAAELPFPDGSFDTIIMNDFMEHVSEPEKALSEALRLLSPGGKLFVNFPPYYHPFGAHLSDAINIPWAHVFFSEKALIAAYKELVRGLPDEKERLSLRFSEKPGGGEYISYINKMTLRRFKKIIREKNVKPVYKKEIPLRPFLMPLAMLPPVKEAFVKMAVYVFGK